MSRSVATIIVETMKSSHRIELLFFVLAALLLVGVAMTLPPKARTDIATICRAGTPASPAQRPRPLP